MTATRTPRLLFLLAVILGLGWMHTIGSHGHHDAGSGNPHVMTVAAVHDSAPGTAGISVPADENGPSVAMCLAILAAAVVLAALIAVRVRRAGAGFPGRRDPVATGHGPPRLIPPGLLIASSTVLRI
ncbi:hypothetical protein [Phytomonospora endophytica]|uniref:Uncharacterized protein n=1 Tax=Phytomonospora endophytica TaxID=714109 RepID=A0A841FEW8_9ACTN|nr:hypothetical protein [Phytomonospora endophytica]MBB6035851.1 hypothetical protein [Phytomonospora endophytica]GIG71530.1 hypothetical protein Pen01_78250 [Phytomonospora endophytica]